MKRTVLTSLCALSLLASSTRGAQLAPQPGDITPKVDAIFKGFVGQPGCNVGVVHSGKLVLERSYGLADISEDMPLGPETRFDIGSMSKQFTAAAVLILADQGKIGLDDEIHKYVPELPSYGAKVTIRQMLHHTSGIMDDYELLKLSGWVYGDAVSEHDALWALTRMPKLNFAPGTRESYSGGNYLLLGLVVKRVSGKPLGAYLQSTIFGPLGMTHTVLTGDHSVVVPHEARPYAVLDGSPHLLENRFDSVGDGGIVTTVEDLALWERNFACWVIASPVWNDLLRLVSERRSSGNGRRGTSEAGRSNKRADGALETRQMGVIASPVWNDLSRLARLRFDAKPLRMASLDSHSADSANRAASDAGS